MVIVSAGTIGECWLESIRSVLENGENSYDEDVVIHEVLGLCVEISTPKSDDKIISELGDVFVIQNMIKKFSKGVVMEDRPFTYGQLIYDFNGVDQFKWLIQRLKKKKETKSATINFLAAGLDDVSMPCLNTVDVKTRDEHLHLQFFFRSQNVFGRQYANLVSLSMLHESLAEEAGFSVGKMSGYIASAHIYEYDIEQAKNIIDGQHERIADQYYIKGPLSVRRN